MKIISLNQEEEIKIQIQILIQTQTQIMENQTLEMIKTLIRRLLVMSILVDGRSLTYSL